MVKRGGLKIRWLTPTQVRTLLGTLFFPMTDKTQNTKKWFEKKSIFFYPHTIQGYSITALFTLFLIWRLIVAKYDPYLFIWELLFAIIVYQYISKTFAKE